MPSTQEDEQRTLDEPAEVAPEPSEPPGPFQLFRPLAIAVLIALVGGGLLALRGPVGGEAPASANRALADVDATTKVVGDVSNALTRVFSYTSDDTATAERAAAEVLSGQAAADYRRLFAKVKQQAPAERLALRTRVVRAGAVSLTGGTAHLLVFLDQATTRNGKPAGSVAAAQLSVTAELKDGLWRITGLKSS